MELKVKMNFYKETKNKIRYNEDGNPPDHVIGTLYIPKTSLPSAIPPSIIVIVKEGEVANPEGEGL